MSQSPRLLAADDPAAVGLAAVVRIESADLPTALAELCSAIEQGAGAVIVPDLEAARDFLTVHDALYGRAPVDPELALDPALRREPPSAD